MEFYVIVSEIDGRYLAKGSTKYNKFTTANLENAIIFKNRNDVFYTAMELNTISGKWTYETYEINKKL